MIEFEELRTTFLRLCNLHFTSPLHYQLYSDDLRKRIMIIAQLGNKKLRLQVINADINLALTKGASMDVMLKEFDMVIKKLKDQLYSMRTVKRLN